MIVRTFPPGKGCLGLVRYLEHGEAGEHRDRVLWVESRNLPTDDPETAARLMAADARLSVRTQRPVYHFAVSFDPGDPVDRASMCHVVDALLRRLGLEEHQALLVAHKDTEHPHVHVVVNRVHPETHLAWNNSWDWPKIEKVLREQEVELGLRRVPGHFGRVPGRQPAPRLERGDAAFLRSVQERAAHVLLYAWPWAEVEKQLAAAGLAVRIKGGGLTIHDGRREVKASDVHRECSRRHMERRLGRWSTRHGSSVSEPEPVLDPAVDEAVRAFDAYEEAAELALRGRHLREERAAAESVVARLADQDHALRRARRDIRAVAATVYTNPDDALEAWNQLVLAERGHVERAAEKLVADPSRLGTLLSELRTGLQGMLGLRTTEHAREAVPRLAKRASAYTQAERAVNAPVEWTTPEGETIRGLDRVRAAAQAVIDGKQKLIAATEGRLKEVGGVRGAERAAQQAFARLNPAQLAQASTRVGAGRAAGLLAIAGRVTEFTRAVRTVGEGPGSL